MSSMPNTPRFLITTLLLGTLAACGGDAKEVESDVVPPPASGAATGASSGGNADLAEMSQHRLTLDDVRRWAAIRPALERIDFSRTAKRELSDSPTIDELEELYDGNPEARAAIEKGGMDVRDFVVTTFVLLQGGFAQHLMSKGITRDSAAKVTDISAENIEFLERNAAEIRKIQEGSAR